MGDAYEFVLAGYGLWDEGMRPVPRNGIATEYELDWSVALSSDRALIGADERDEKGDGSGAA